MGGRERLIIFDKREKARRIRTDSVEKKMEK